MGMNEFRTTIYGGGGKNQSEGERFHFAVSVLITACHAIIVKYESKVELSGEYGEFSRLSINGVAISVTSATFEIFIYIFLCKMA